MTCTPEEKRRALEKLDAAFQMRAIYRKIYASDEGAIVLAEEMDQAGTYSLNPDLVKPALMAEVNRKLASLGIITPSNILAYVRAILATSTDEDLQAERKRWLAMEEEN